MDKEEACLRAGCTEKMYCFGGKESLCKEALDILGSEPILRRWRESKVYARVDSTSASQLHKT